MDFTSQTITVDSVERTYKKAFVPKYAKQLQAGNTVTLKCDTTAPQAGTSILRVSHDESKGVQRHLVSIEDITVDADGVEHIRKVHTVLSCDTGSPTEETDVEDLSDGFDSWFAGAGIKDAIINGEV